jgi:hypothetical protein
VFSSGLCRTHYDRKRRGVEVDKPILVRDPDRGCSVDGCSDKHREGGYCAFHIQRFKRGAPLDAPKQVQHSRADNPVCSVAGCGQPNYAAALCRGHYRRKVNGGSMTAPIRPVNVPVGTVRAAQDGYLTEKAPDGRWTGQHRLRMEEKLGRPLLPDESVHHINGQRDDNRLENLELWSRYQPSGQRVADKVEWAKELLLRYDPDSLTCR